jgi:hypothetical protein
LHDIRIDLIQALFVPVTSARRVVIWNVVFALFVNGVISKMHVLIFHVACFRWLVLLSCETCQALFEEINSHGVDASQQHVYSKVEFESFDQVRWIYVMLGHNMIVWVDVFPVFCQENAFTLTLAFWLNYEYLVLSWLFSGLLLSVRLQRQRPLLFR